jgi:hypothetical protein
LEEENEVFLCQDEISDFDALHRAYTSCDTAPKGFLVERAVAFLCFILVDLDAHIPHIQASVKITADLCAQVCISGVPASKVLMDPFLSNGKITHLSQLMNLLCFLKSYNNNESDHRWKWMELASNALKQLLLEQDGTKDFLFRPVSFIVEQLSLLTKNVHARRYSSSLLTFAYLLFSSSPSCYDVLCAQNVMRLPHKRTLIRLSQKLDTTHDNANSQYMKMRLSKLNPFESTVSLLIDEMYISSKLEYSGGEIIGHCEGGLANTVLCFMISSVCSEYRDVVSLIPMKHITTNSPRNFIVTSWMQCDSLSMLDSLWLLFL